MKYHIYFAGQLSMGRVSTHRSGFLNLGKKMNKFKVGDTVKLVQADPHACFKAGAVGTVVADMEYAGGADTLQWLVLSGGINQIISEEYLEAYDEAV